MSFAVPWSSSAVDSSSPGEDLAALDHEIKWTVGPGRIAAVAAHLEGLCRADVEYPTNTVASIYFDTPDLALLREKLNSDYLKTKVRLRWYPVAGEPSTRCFLEVKRRVGTRRTKTRRPLHFGPGGLRGAGEEPWDVRREVDAGDCAAVDSAAADCDTVDCATADLETVSLSAMKPLDLRALPELADLPAPLLPVLEVRYRRRRYQDPFSSARLCLDSEIHPGRVHPLVGRSAVPLGISSVSPAVVESKGLTSDPPSCLGSITSTLCFRSSFSKYSVCFAALGVGEGRSGELS